LIQILCEFAFFYRKFPCPNNQVGKFKNLSRAIREIRGARLRKEGIIIKKDETKERRITRIVKLMHSKKQPCFQILSEKTAAELIGEGRER
jgi:hypothetical protein